MEEPIFISNSDPYHLVASFIGVLVNLASQSKAKRKNLFLDSATTIKIKMGSILEKLTQHHNRRESARFDMSQDCCDNEICASTQFLQIQKINYLIFKNLWNVIAMFYLFLVSTVQNTISTKWNPICYPFLLTSETLNPQSSRKRTSSSRSNLVIFSYWTYWTFMAEQQALIHSWRHTKLQKQNDFSPTNDLITLTNAE